MLIRGDLVLMLLCAVQALKFIQNDYEMDFYRMELTYEDEEYMRNTKLTTFKINRTQAAVNFTTDILVDYGNELQIIVEGYKFVSNEYRDFPINFESNFCEAMNENYCGMQTFHEHGEFPRCPMKKGHYYVYKWFPDESKFPPFIPNGNYRFTYKFMFKKTKAFVIISYMEVSRPFYSRRNGKNQYRP